MKGMLQKYGMPLLLLGMIASFAGAQYGQDAGYSGPAMVVNGPITPTGGTNLQLNSSLTSTDNAGRTVRLNSITNTGTANSMIGFQSKPGQGATMANNVIGAEISPRVNDTFALTGSGSLIGLHVDTYLKGTTGNIAGDVRGEQIELVTDDAGTRTVSGDLMGLRFRSAWSGTVTGAIVPLKVEQSESQTNSKSWTAVLKLTGVQPGVWNDAPGTEAGTADGYIKVIVNNNVRYIQLYSQAPVD